MVKIEETIIKQVQQELNTIKSFVGKDAFSPSDIDDLIGAHRSASAFVQLAMSHGSGLTDSTCSTLRQLDSEIARVMGSINTRNCADPSNAPFAAMEFSLKEPKGKEFLRLWLDGNFDRIREEWPNAPEDVYLGVDYFHKPSLSALVAK